MNLLKINTEKNEILIFVIDEQVSMKHFLVVSEGCKMKKENQENSNSYSAEKFWIDELFTSIN